jgi:hypothetical protein
MTTSAQAVDRADPATQPAHRCVLLSPSNQPQSSAHTQSAPPQRPSALLRGLRTRGVEVVMASDPPAVMVALAERPCDILIVHGPIDDEQIQQLIAAARQFHPRLALWQYACIHGGQSPTLCRVPDQASAPTADPASAAPQPPERKDAATSADVHVGPRDDEPLLTGEELRMLLGDDDDDDDDDDLHEDDKHAANDTDRRADARTQDNADASDASSASSPRPWGDLR